MNKEKQWNCRAGINGWHQENCPHQKQQSDWEEDLAIIHRNYESTVSLIRQLLIEEYRKGYNACLKDFKIPNKYGEKSL